MMVFLAVSAIFALGVLCLLPIAHFARKEYARETARQAEIEQRWESAMTSPP